MLGVYSDLLVKSFLLNDFYVGLFRLSYQVFSDCLYCICFGFFPDLLSMSILTHLVSLFWSTYFALDLFWLTYCVVGQFWLTYFVVSLCILTYLLSLFWLFYCVVSLYWLPYCFSLFLLTYLFVGLFWPLCERGPGPGCWGVWQPRRYNYRKNVLQFKKREGCFTI